MSGIGIGNYSVLKHFIDNYFPINYTCCCFKENQSSHDFRKRKVSKEDIFVGHPQKKVHFLTKIEEQSQQSRMVSAAKPNKADATSLRFNLSIPVLMVISAVLIQTITSVFFPRLTPIVALDDGQVQGKIAYSRCGREYWQFLSIPFAEAPVDNLKFEPPIRAKPWNGVKQVTSWPPFCIQFEAVLTQQVFGEEDCLFLNVFAQPFKSGSKRRKVLIYVHGGGFLEGGSRLFGPDYFMDEDLIVVTFNYRLGPFGFLNFNHDSEIDGVELPRGNMGMKDQLLVLKWVQNNIEHFGGDKNRVTLFGDSAGSVSVQLHVLSPQSKGLFHRAISQSGSIFSSWAFTTQPKRVAENFAKQLDCPTVNTSALLNCLQNYDPREMVKFQLSCTDPTILKDNLSPSVEHVLREDTFLPTHPSQILESGNFSQVLYIMGVNSADGALRTGRFEALSTAVPTVRANWTEMLGNVLLLDRFPQSFLDTLTLMFSDVYAFEPSQRAAIAHARSCAPTYLFYYDYRPRFIPGIYSAFKGSFAPQDWLPTEVKINLTMGIDWVNEHLLGGKGAHQYGAVHGEEIPLLWNFGGVSRWFSWWEFEFSQSFVKMIADFARGTNNIKFKGRLWPQITVSNDNTTHVLPYMLLDNSRVGKVIPEPFADRMKFWNSIGITTFN